MHFTCTCFTTNKASHTHTHVRQPVVEEFKSILVGKEEQHLLEVGVDGDGRIVALVVQERGHLASFTRLD